MKARRYHFWLLFSALAFTLFKDYILLRHLKNLDAKILQRFHTR